MTTLVEGVADLRARCDDARAAGARVGLVPTMGYLHAGHCSLMRSAREQCDLVVTSIFVNPLQFGENEDLDTYPRDLDGDLAACAEVGVDLVFHPSSDEMYPCGVPRTTVHVDGLTDDLCGASRPTHFDGVTTVVAKLLSVVGACRAYFGRKDYQQLVVVRRMAADLDLPVTVVGCPIVREPDGIAMSSRNAYLDAGERVAAQVLSRALFDAVEAIRTGERDPQRVARRLGDWVRAEPQVELDYAEVRDADDLAPIEVLSDTVLIAVAARVGSTRLIDNVRCSIRGDEIDADLGVYADGSAVDTGIAATTGRK